MHNYPTLTEVDLSSLPDGIKDPFALRRLSNLSMSPSYLSRTQDIRL